MSVSVSQPNLNHKQPTKQTLSQYLIVSVLQKSFIFGTDLLAVRANKILCF
jgi:hypothetical protein